MKVSNELIKYLIYEAVNNNNFVELYDYYIQDYIIYSEQLTLKSILCIAIIVVGSKAVDKFHVISELLCHWEIIGGPYWVIQLELIRHFTISELTDYYIDDRKNNIDDLFEYYFIKNSRNLKLLLKINELAIEMKVMKKQLDNSNSNEDLKMILFNYSASYPLDDFVKWFVDQIRIVINKYKDIKDEVVYINDRHNIADIFSDTLVDEEVKSLDENIINVISEDIQEIGKQNQFSDHGNESKDTKKRKIADLVEIVHNQNIENNIFIDYTLDNQSNGCVNSTSSEGNNIIKHIKTAVWEFFNPEFNPNKV